MTGNYCTNYITSNKYKTDHSTFGGIIDIEDFNTYTPNKRRISNQIDAINFQRQLLIRQNKRKENEKYKDMTLEELKEMRLISNTDGRPTSTLTNESGKKNLI